MTYYVHSDSLKKVGLSVRCSNTLFRAKIRTVGDMLALDREQMSKIRNLGAKSIEEIEQLQKEIKQTFFEQFAANNGEFTYMKEAETVPIFVDKSGTLRRDIPIKELELSYRSNRILSEAGYDFASKLLDITAEQLLALPYIGKGSVEEILSKVAGIEFEEVKPKSKKNKQAEKDCMQYISSFVRHLPTHIAYIIHIDDLYEALLPYYENAYEKDAPVNINSFFEAPVLRNLVVNKIIAALDDSSFGVSMEDILHLFPDTLVSTYTVNTILHELSAEGKIRLGQTVELSRPNLREYVDSISDDMYREILKLRLQGKTLEEIAKIIGDASRERIRQVIKKCIEKKRIIIEEDKFKKIYETYSFSKEDFSAAFNTDNSVYIYMTLACNKAGTLPIEQFLEDVNFPVELRKGAERAVYKNYITVAGKRILKQRPELADYVARTYFQDEAAFDSFVEKYNDVLKDLDLADDSRFILNKASYQNRFVEAENILWKYQSRFRYYDMQGRDFEALLEGLNLEQYTDAEYSSLKLFRSYPELMEEYDIRDEYELHNLLKKLYAKKGTNSISFSRMPIIEFGKADRDNQVLDLLIRLAPISIRDFCAAYEAEYGVLARTVAGGFVSCIDKYRGYNGVFEISIEPLPANQVEKMRKLLPGDYYDIAFIKQLYQREFPAANPSMINSYTLKSLGFKVFCSYVIKDSFTNAAEYFRYILTANNVVDARSFPATLTSQIAYAGEVYSLKNSYEIIEFRPMKYITRRGFEKLGITTQDLYDYCDKVSEFVQPQTYFTIHSLKRRGFSHSLDNLGFDDWFYASILKEDKKRYRYQRMGGAKVFWQSAQQVTLAGLLQFIVEQRGSIDFNVLIELLKEEYNIRINKHRIVEAINSSPMYYDRVTKRVYPNNIAAEGFIGNDIPKERLTRRNMLSDNVEQGVIDFFYAEKADEMK